MAVVTAGSEDAATAKIKKVGMPKIKKLTPKGKGTATHPSTATMVNNAVKNLKERGGSSLQAIKKYISSAYKVDAEKVGPFVKRYLKSAVDQGTLIRTKGKGASGSFKLATSKTTTDDAKKTSAKKVKSGATNKTPKQKKAKASTAKASKSSKKAKKAPAAKKLSKPKPKKTPKKISKKEK